MTASCHQALTKQRTSRTAANLTHSREPRATGNLTERDCGQSQASVNPVTAGPAHGIVNPSADLMGSQLTTLTPADIQRFERDGYVVVRQAFARADGLAMEQQWWRELEETYGIRPDDRSSWRQLPANLKAAKRDPSQAKILTETVRGVFDDLLGRDAWPPPRDWGRPIVTFPEPGAWDVPTRLWHWDNPCEAHLDRMRGLFVVSFIGPVAPRSGGTLILSGSPRLLIQQERQLPPSERRVSIVGGLLVSQMLTLFTTPVIYLWFDRLAIRFSGRSGEAAQPAE